MTATVSPSVQQGIDQANREFERLFNAGDPAAAARAVYSRDARVLPPGADMIEGRDSIAGFWQAAAAQMGIRSVRLSTVELGAQGDGAYEVGRATLGLAGGAEVPVKYVVVWSQEDGAWKWHVDIWNSNS